MTEVHSSFENLVVNEIRTINSLITRSKRVVPIWNLLGITESRQINSLSKDTWRGLNFTAFRKFTVFVLPFMDSLFYNAPLCVNWPASRGRNGKQMTVSFKRRSILLRMRGGSPLFTVSLLTEKLGRCQNEISENRPNAVFSHGAEKRNTHLASL